MSTINRRNQQTIWLQYLIHYQSHTGGYETGIIKNHLRNESHFVFRLRYVYHNLGFIIGIKHFRGIFIIVREYMGVE